MIDLERLVYTSKPAGAMGTLALFNLLTLARKKNSLLKITGHLLFSDGMFTQCIEGPTQSIELLWESLRKDSRHTEIELLMRIPIQERKCPEWDMAFSTYRFLDSADMPGFSPIDADGKSEKLKHCID